MTSILSSSKKPPSPRPGDDDIVITGLSGLFPACSNVKEFAEKLYNHENMVTNDNLRWNYEHPELTEYCGTVPNLDKFDAQFFMVHYHIANHMDAMARKLLEQSYQAIFDAGISPNELWGTKLGVFIGTSLTETEKISAFIAFGFGITGSNRAMFSNRISYVLNAKGPSLTLDASCSGSLVCLEKAYEAMRRGDCDAAIVGGSNIHLHPQTCIQNGRSFHMNNDGKTKCFDKNADGQSPSECISVLFLQKAKYAKRIYATVCNVKSEFTPRLTDTAQHFGPGRDPCILTNFYRDFYRESNISPLDVEYVEAFGSAFPEADKAELKAIQDVFCKNRIDPLFIGSVMSNMGYSQASTTVAALTKVCLAYQTGKISANLHYETPHSDVSALHDGRMHVVTENKMFSRSYSAVNSLSVTGINGHVLLKGRYKPKDVKPYMSRIPYILAVSGRQESAVKMIFEHVNGYPIDPEEIALFHNIYKNRISKHMARGFTILSTDENQKTVIVKEKVDYFDDARRPLWFVFSGMGSQWNGMGKELMRVPVFAAAIQRCREVLKPKGIDLIHILTSDDKDIFENILNSFVGIAAVQIGLTDILLSMGLVPDNIIGHSVGELGCAYADGCLSADQVILAAYYRGLVSLQTPLIKGSMAAIGLGWQQIQKKCPYDIEVACHNSAESCTISGPADALNVFVDTLTKQGIFAKEVNCSNIAYHSRYIKNAGPALLQHLKTIIKDPKPRSKRWLSTSVPKPRWEEPAAKMCSAEYYTNNLLNPVLFEETSEAIPVNAVLIEVAPHGLLQAILKRALPAACTNIPLTRRGHSDNAHYFLEAIGELYKMGYDLDLSILYPKIKFPVSTETRSLSHLVEWVHTESWKLPVYIAADKHHAATYDVTLSTHDDEFSFLRGHIIDDETLFPFAGALVMVWDTLAMVMGVTRKEISVQFKEVHFYTQPPLSDNSLMKLSVAIHKGNGKFQVLNENILMATGYIKAAGKKSIRIDMNNDLDKNIMLYSSEKVYRKFFDIGYGYRGEFRSIQRGTADMMCALVNWSAKNWVTLIDAVIQMNAFRRECDVVEQPYFIQRLSIDVKQHNLAVQALKDGTGCLEAYHYDDKNMTRCGGLVLENIIFANVPSSRKMAVGLKTLQFVPYFREDVVDVTTALYTMLQIIEENRDSTMYALDITDKHNSSYLGYKIKELLPELTGVKLNISRMSTKDVFESKNKVSVLDFVLAENLLTDKNVNYLLERFSPVFVIILEKRSISKSLYKIVASAITPIGRLVLGRWMPHSSNYIPTVVTVTSSKDLTRLSLTRHYLHPDGSLYILSQYPPINELKHLVTQWRKEENKNKVYLAMVDKTSIPNLEAKKLPDFDLAYSVLRKGTWGGYYYTRGGKYEEKEQQAVTLRSAHIGNLDSLYWTEATEFNPKHIPVMVHYAGLNFYDAKKATGDILASPEELTGQYYGMDFSGLTARGERVMGVVRRGAVATKIAAEPMLLWPVPEHWTLEDAATVPLAYAHAFYCFGIKCNLNPGMSVLVHGGAGALGQAAIFIALANGCNIFTTVSDTKKKTFLIDMFPELNVNNIGCSRDDTFGDMVMKATNGVGCDIIISCCAKAGLKDITVNCCAANGTTLDTHEVHSKEFYNYGMYNMSKCRSYIAVDFSTVFSPENFAELQHLQLIVSEGIARGYVRPLSRIVCRASKAARGLRLLAGSRHRGKVLLHIHGETLLASKRLVVEPEGSNLVLAAADDDDTLSIRIIDLLIARGAVNIVFHRLRTEKFKTSNTNVFDDKMAHWQKLGAKVINTIGDLHEMTNAEEFIKCCSSFGQVDGIYVIADTTGKTDKENILKLLSDLDNVTRRTCSNIRHFSFITNNGEYGHNTFMNRSLDELPGLMLQIENIAKFNKTNDNVEEICTEKNTYLRNLMLHVEKALCLTEPVAVVNTWKKKECLLDQIISMNNLNLKVKLNDKRTLHDFGLPSDKIQELLKLLQNYNVVVTTEEIQRMTLSELNVFEMEEVKCKYSTGLEVLFSEGEYNELRADEELIFLHTPVQKSSKVGTRDEGLDLNASYLIMVPGMDGHYEKFESLRDRLKLSAVVCQPGFDHPDENITQMAERLVKVVLKRIRPKEKFYLLGYSFGVLVAIEMAVFLENHGLTGVVFCIDASPDTFSSAMDRCLHEAGATDNAKLQNAIVQHMYSRLTGNSSDQLVSKLQESKSWNDRIEVGISQLKEGRHSMQYARSAIETAYARIVHTRQYDGKHINPLRSQLVLLRCQSNPTASPDLGLSRYSKQNIPVYNLLADHANALEDLRCANIINRHLDKSILNYFYKTNFCNMYVYSPVSHTLRV